MPDDIAKNAGSLARYITNEVLDGERVSALSILDALASLELKLVSDEAGESTSPYYDRIRQTMARRH